MRKYLASLPDKSPQHKKHFALAASSAVTLTIFAFWALANFGTGGVASENASPAAARRAVEVSPFESLKQGISDGFSGLYDTLGSLKESVSGNVDIKADYGEMKANVLNTYGQ